MSPMDTMTTTEGIRFPRVSGDEPSCRSVKHRGQMFSPRERG